MRTILNWADAELSVGRGVLEHDRNLLALFLAHRGALVTYARGILGDHARAEDVVQEAYLRLTDASGTRAIDEPQGYLYRIVRNLAVDSRRRVLPAEAIADQIALDRPSPEAEALHRDQLRIVSAALAELPERSRVALELHRLEGLKLREIADRLGISTTSAHTLIAEAIEHCKQRLRHPQKLSAEKHRSRSSYDHEQP